jgi:TolA-binding protein
MQEAAALNHLGRHDEAIASLQDVTNRFRTSSLAVEAQFQIGYTYETLLDSPEEARAAYEKVSTLPGRSIFKQQAMQRADALRSIAELEEEAGSGDAALEARADAAFRIAEILYLDRELLDEAIAEYEEVESQFSETRAAPRAAYALAYIRWKETGDSTQAQDMFRELVAQYPASPQARDAIDLLASQQADTSGLRELLVTPEPDTVIVPSMVDTLASVAVSPQDSMMISHVDSLGRLPDRRRISHVDSLGRLPDRRRISHVDSLRGVPDRPRTPSVDSLGRVPDSTGISFADSLAGAPDSTGISVADSLARVPDSSGVSFADSLARVPVDSVTVHDDSLRRSGLIPESPSELRRRARSDSIIRARESLEGPTAPDQPDTLPQEPPGSEPGEGEQP